jgi:hypothetical protein
MDAASSTPDSSSDSSDSYNSNDASRYLREWRMVENRYTEATWENSQLETHLRVAKVALHATKEEACATRARPAETDAMVAGKL